MRYLLVGAVALLLAACDSRNTWHSSAQSGFVYDGKIVLSETRLGTWLWRYEIQDPVVGPTVCYVYASGTGGGISCVNVSEVTPAS